MWLEAEKARNFNAVVWVLGEVNGYHYVDLFFNLLSDKSTDRRADITHSVMAVLRKDFIGFTRLPWQQDILSKCLATPWPIVPIIQCPSEILGDTDDSQVFSRII